MFASFFVAAVVNVLGEYFPNYSSQLVGFYIFGTVISFILVVCDDIMTVLYPALLVSMFSIKCYNSFEIFIRHWPLGVVVVACLVFHFIYYRFKVEIGPTFWGLLGVSVAVTLGGVGKITAEQYFSPTALFYTLGLGFGMLGAYVLMSAHIGRGKGYQLNIKFANIMVMMGVYACFMVLHHYLIHFNIVLEGNGVLAFQWRNNIATFLMLALPFPFYKSSKNRHIYLYVGVMMYLCLLLTGSRGAFAFGSVEFAMCVISVLVYDRKNRKSNLLLFAVMIGLSMLFLGKILNFFSDVTNRLTIESGEFDVRLKLYKRAVEDFLSNPVFGRGLGYMGNRDIHPSTQFALCWYHSLPFQIIGSFGIVGVLGYGVQYFFRFKVLIEDFRSRLNITVFLSFAGLQMMSMVNPGEFCPIPYALLCVMMFIVVEKCNAVRKLGKIR
ncbi:MAG: O-antigen ligase family protein [Clostridia bacterium]|nr:O-antigen ligase family protein [Clostridia bacterium]